MKYLFLFSMFFYDLLLPSVSLAQVPAITNFFPLSATANQQGITITGNNFNTTPANNAVFFGATRATVTAASTTQLTVTVPVGATYQNMSVTNLTTGLTAYSAKPFSIVSDCSPPINSTSFYPKVDYSVPGASTSAISDLDGDGKSDIIVLRPLANQFSVFRNTSISGTVSIAARTDYNAPGSPSSIVTGDIDGDAKPDIIIANSSSNTISIFRNLSTPGTLSFAAKIDYPTGVLPSSISMGDINADGKPDLAVSNSTDNTVSVFRNQSASGTISFAVKVDFVTGNNPKVVLMGDLDIDGSPDLAVLNNGSNTVSIIRNTSTTGIISFAAKMDYATGTNPVGASLGDLDLDGKIDLAVLSTVSNTFSVFKNMSIAGTISLVTRVDYSSANNTTSATNPINILINDVNGDTLPDLTITNNSFLTIFTNTSTANSVSFGTGVSFPQNSNSVSIGDLDGDGRSEVIPVSTTQGSISTMQNVIGPIMTSTATRTICSGGTVSINLSADLPSYFTWIATDNPNTTGESLILQGGYILNNTITNNTTSAQTVTYTVEPTSGACVGRPQVVQVTVNPIASITTQPSTASQLLCVTGSFSPLSVSATPPGFLTYQWYVKDYNSTVANPISGATASTYTPPSNLVGGANYYAKVKLGSCITDSEFSGNIIPSFTSINHSYNLSAQTVCVNNRFSPLSIAITSIPYNNLTYQWYSNTTNSTSGGTLISGATSPSYTPPSITPGTRYYYVTYGGTCDPTNTVLSGAMTVNSGCTYNTNNISFTPSNGAVGEEVTITGNNFNATPASNAVFFGAAKATVINASTTQLTVTAPAGATYQNISVTNLSTGITSYSTKPFSLTSYCSQTIASSSFNPKVDYPAPGASTSIVNDLDVDGKSDMIVVRPSANQFSVFRNTSTMGMVSFATRVDYSSPGSPGSILASDIDGDGKADIITVNASSNTISIFRNISTIGTIAFATKVDFITGPLPVSIAMGDLNGDGKADLTVVNSSGNTVSIFRNLSTSGSISFAPKVDYVTGNNPIVVMLGDLDRDAMPDLVVLNNGSNTVSIFMNTSSGGTLSLAAKTDYGTPTSPVSISLGDLNYDDKIDLAVLSTSSNTFSILKNTSTAGAFSFAAKIDFASTNNDTSATNPLSILISDVNNDYTPDLTITNSSYLTIFSLSSTYPLAFTPGVSYSQNVNANSASVGDLDGDSKPEVIQVSSTSGTTSVMRNVGGPSMTSLSSKNVCSGSSINLALTSSYWNSTFSWVAVDNPNTTGESLTLSTGSVLNDIIINNSSHQQIVSYTITPTSPDGSCTGRPQTVQIWVNPIPVITAQPSNATQTVCLYGSTTPLSVTATEPYPGALSYQWYSNTTNSNIGGILLWSGGATYAPSADVTGTKYYYVVVKFGSGCSSTSAVSGPITTIPPAKILIGPSSVAQTVCQNGTFSTLYVNAYMHSSITFQWYSNTTNSNSGGTPISGATDAGYTPPSSTPGPKYYYVTSTGTCGVTVTSTVSGARIVNELTVISVHPSSSSQTVCQNAIPIPLTVSATGSGISYQWYSNTTSGSTLINGATNPNFTPPSSTSGIYYYYVIITSNCGAITSTISGPITINALPTITSQPPTSVQSICENGITSPLSIAATNSGTLNYQWYSNTTNSNTGGNLISGATALSYTPPLTTIGTKFYYVTVNGTCGTVSNVSGAITINSLTTITSQPSGSGQSVCQNGAASSLSVAATSTGTLTYQWYSNTTNSNTGGNLINSATASSYTPPLIIGTMYYYVTVTGICGIKTSNVSGAITVNPIATPIITPGTSTTFCQGNSVTLTANSGASYLWSTGATTQSISVGASGSYSVTVTNPGGCSAASAPVTTVVNPVPSTPTIAGPSSGLLCGSTTLMSSAASSYLWSNGATTQTITATAGGNYTVTTGANGCTATSAPFTLTDGRPKLRMTAGSTNFCGGATATFRGPDGSSYLWSNGATTQSITVSTSGSYSVTVTNPFYESYLIAAESAGGRTQIALPLTCSGTYTSAMIIIAAKNCQGSSLIAATEEEEKQEYTLVYPNPSHEEAYVVIPQPAATREPISIFDLHGKVVFESHFEKGEYSKTIYTRDMAEGMYMVRIGKSTNKKLVIVH